MNGVYMWRYLRKHSLFTNTHRVRLDDHDIFVGADGVVVSPVSDELAKLLHKHTAFKWEEPAPLTLADVVALAQSAESAESLAESKEIQSLTAAILEAYASSVEPLESAAGEEQEQEQEQEQPVTKRRGRARKAE